MAISKVDGVSVLYASGLIDIWHGTIANIPSGWVICDGNNSTPNLLAKFVEGVATAATNPGTTGGATSKTTAGHTHNLTHPTDTDGAYRTDDEARMIKYSPASAPGSGAWLEDPTDSQTDSISDIRPLYYDVAFIMKT